jgi:hypothetical protein
MKPRFSDMETWRQAELLMQPAFIRLVDNLRKQLETSEWQGTYEEVLVWADGIPEDVKANVAQLQTQLQSASPAEAADIEATLAHLPSPYPGYELRLTSRDRAVRVDLWELCYKICFQVDGEALNDDRPVQVDTTLLEADTGEVDWNQLESKTKQLVTAVFAELPQ